MTEAIRPSRPEGDPYPSPLPRSPSTDGCPELSPIFADGLKDQAAAIWDCR